MYAHLIFLDGTEYKNGSQEEQFYFNQKRSALNIQLKLRVTAIIDMEISSDYVEVYAKCKVENSGSGIKLQMIQIVDLVMVAQYLLDLNYII